MVNLFSCILYIMYRRHCMIWSMESMSWFCLKQWSLYLFLHYTINLKLHSEGSDHYFGNLLFWQCYKETKTISCNLPLSILQSYTYYTHKNKKKKILHVGSTISRCIVKLLVTVLHILTTKTIETQQNKTPGDFIKDDIVKKKEKKK